MSDLRPRGKRRPRCDYSADDSKKIFHDSDGVSVVLVPCPLVWVVVVRPWFGWVGAATYWHPRTVSLAYILDNMEGLTMKFLKKVAEAKARTKGAASQWDKAFATEHPALWEYLTVEQWEDGTERQTATLSCFADGGSWKICLNDRESSQVLFGTGSSLEVCLGTLEQLLQAPGGAPWRASRFRGDKGGKGSKRA